jgi:hypothetical protein
MFVSLFQIRRQHIFDPFHECADSARQIAPMGTVKLAESRLGRSRADRLDARDDNSSRPNLRRPSLPW